MSHLLFLQKMIQDYSSSNEITEYLTQNLTSTFDEIISDSNIISECKNNIVFKKFMAKLGSCLATEIGTEIIIKAMIQMPKQKVVQLALVTKELSQL